jgi:nitrate reductase gamma subunit
MTFTHARSGAGLHIGSLAKRHSSLCSTYHLAFPFQRFVHALGISTLISAQPFDSDPGKLPTRQTLLLFASPAPSS